MTNRTATVSKRLAHFALSWWRPMRWPLLAVATLVTFVLGFLGFRDYFDGQNVDKSTLDLVYLSLQLFTLESGSVPETSPPWPLELARLAASAAAIVAAVAVAFRDQIREWRLRRERGHIVVCGLGSSGARLVTGLLDAGYRVVGIDVDESNPVAASLRRRGAVVITGEGLYLLFQTDKLSSFAKAAVVSTVVGGGLLLWNTVRLKLRTSHYDRYRGVMR